MLAGLALPVTHVAQRPGCIFHIPPSSESPAPPLPKSLPAPSRADSPRQLQRLCAAACKAMGACPSANPLGIPPLPWGWVSHPGPQQHRETLLPRPRKALVLGVLHPIGSWGAPILVPFAPSSLGEGFVPYATAQGHSTQALGTACSLANLLSPPAPARHDSFEECSGAASNLTLPAASPARPRPLLGATCAGPRPRPGTAGVSPLRTRDGQYLQK